MDDESKLPQIVEEKPTDIVGKDASELQSFIAAGKPGVLKVQEADVKKMFDLYLAGKSYSQISGIMRTPKPLVLFLSHKMSWFDIRQEHILDLQMNDKRRIIEVGLMSRDVMIQTVQAWNKKFSAKLNRYMTTDDEKFSDALNLKEYAMYLKTIELLQKTIAEPVPKGPLVGITMPDGGTLTRTDNNTIEVTPKQKAVGNMLKQYADMQRKENKK